jgi:hypothetical protein
LTIADGLFDHGESRVAGHQFNDHHSLLFCSP